MDNVEHFTNEDIMEMLTAMYITQRRTYDVLARMLFNLDGAAALELMEDHERGEFFGPDPSMVIRGEDGTGE